MKKSILKNVAIISFALFGLGIIGNNVLYATTEPIEDPGDGTIWYQSMGYCGGSSMKLCCTETKRGSYCSYYECIC